MSQAKNPGLAVLKQNNGAEKIGFENESVRTALRQRVTYIETLAELRASTNLVGMVQVQSISGIPGTGGGAFHADPADSATADDGDLTIVDAAGVRWKRDRSNIIVKNTNYLMGTNPANLDPNAGACVILGSRVDAGSSLNKIGIQGAVVDQAEADPALATFLDWDPSDYSLNTTGVGLTTLAGGYDNVQNGYASSIIAGLHAQIGASTTGHNIIAGGSNNHIKQGGRCGIFSSYKSAILSNSEHNLIIGGSNVRILGAAFEGNTTLNGRDNEIRTGRHSALIGGELNVIDTPVDSGSGSNRSAIVAGAGNRVAALGAVVLGGTNNEAESNGAVAYGNDVRTIAGGALHQGVDKLVQVGDSQHLSVVQNVRTTTASTTTVQRFNQNTGTSSPIILPNASSFAGSVTLVAMRDGSAAGNNDGDFSMVHYRANMGGFTSDTNQHLFTETAETTLGTGAKSLTLNAVSQANNAFTPAAAPVLYMFPGGNLTLRVSGIAGVAINWVIRLEFVMTRVG